jgi:hypothetical protein
MGSPLFVGPLQQVLDTRSPQMQTAVKNDHLASHVGGSI